MLVALITVELPSQISASAALATAVGGVVHGVKIRMLSKPMSLPPRSLVPRKRRMVVAELEVMVYSCVAQVSAWPRLVPKLVKVAPPSVEMRTSITSVLVPLWGVGLM